VTILNPTPPDRLCDASGRPYFLWDLDMTLAELRAALAGDDQVVSAYLLGKVMRQAKPDDVLTLATPQTLADRWAEVTPYLGTSRPFWTWLLDEWRSRGLVRP